MRITYVANIRMPTEKAHGAQIMKACEAFAKQGVLEGLVVTDRKTPIQEDPIQYYGLKTTFPIHRAKTLDTMEWGPIGFFIETFSFALSAARQIPKDTIIYTREEAVAWVLSHLTRNKIVWESHDGSWNFFARRVAKRCAHMVVVTGGAKEFYIEMGVPKDKIHVTPNGIDLEAFQHAESQMAARARLDLPINKKLVMYIGAFGGWKGTDTLLKASRSLPPQTIVCIGGNETQVASLKEIYPDVIFLGLRPFRELGDNQRAADVLVVPNTGKDPVSVRFTSPLKLLSHMASGVPVVASDLPSVRELTGEEGAFLVPADDPRALAQGIERVLNDQQLAKSLASAASARVSHFSWDERATNILRVIANK